MDKLYTVICAIELASNQIINVKCSCPAGVSQSCVHVSAMLHAIECIFAYPNNNQAALAAGESKTSYECSWMKPRSHKMEATCCTDLHYCKHEYGRASKKRKNNSDFDPRPPMMRSEGNVEAGRKSLVEGLKGLKTCAELLL